MNNQNNINNDMQNTNLNNMNNNIINNAASNVINNQTFIQNKSQNQPGDYNGYRNQNNINNGNDSSAFLTIKFKLKNNQTVDSMVADKKTSFRNVFELAKNAHLETFASCQYKNPIITFGGIKIDFNETIANFMQNDNNNEITFEVKEKSDIKKEPNIINYGMPIEDNSTTNNINSTNVKINDIKNYQDSNEEKYNISNGEE